MLTDLATLQSTPCDPNRAYPEQGWIHDRIQCIQKLYTEIHSYQIHSMYPTYSEDSPLRKRCIKKLRHGIPDFGLRKLPMGPWETPCDLPLTRFAKQSSKSACSSSKCLQQQQVPAAAAKVPAAARDILPTTCPKDLCDS